MGGVCSFCKERKNGERVNSQPDEQMLVEGVEGGNVGTKGYESKELAPSDAPKAYQSNNPPSRPPERNNNRIQENFGTFGGVKENFPDNKEVNMNYYSADKV
jgi:hypothetical protein